MQGPTAANTRRAPSASMEATAASTTPRTRPLHPAWATPTTPSSLDKATGAQSAVSTASAAPAQRVTAASAAAPRHAPGWPTTTTSLPCTWPSQVHSNGARAERASGNALGSEKSPANLLADRTTAPPGSTDDQVNGGSCPTLVLARAARVI